MIEEDVIERLECERLERLEQFDPEDLTPEEREEFRRWWDNLYSTTQQQARQAKPAEAMVADVVTYDRYTAYRLTINASDELLTARRQLQKLKERIAGLEAVNKFLSSELDRRIRQ